MGNRDTFEIRDNIVIEKLRDTEKLRKNNLLL